MHAQSLLKLDLVSLAQASSLHIRPFCVCVCVFSLSLSLLTQYQALQEHINDGTFPEESSS